MSRPTTNPTMIARAALQRAAAVRMPLSFPGHSAELEVQPGAAGVHYLVDAKSGERLGCSIDAGVLERTRIFFQ